MGILNINNKYLQLRKKYLKFIKDSLSTVNIFFPEKKFKNIHSLLNLLNFFELTKH